MANTKYDAGGEGFLDGSISWTTDTIKLALVSAGYTPVVASDRFLTDVPGADIIATSDAFTGKTAASSIADADDLNFAAVPAGADIHYLVIFKDTGDSATSRLIGVIDDAGNLPYTPTGGPLAVAWDTGPDKIFKL